MKRDDMRASRGARTDESEEGAVPVSSSDDIRVHAVVAGLVQGVGFRYFTVMTAGKLGLGICIDNGEKKYSSCCVIPYDAFGWGNAVYLHTHHRWPTLLRNETITAAEARAHLAHIVGQRLAQGYDQVWIVDGEKVKVIEK